MLPQELAKKHPILYHSTRPEAVPGIRKHGLLTTKDMMDLFELSDERRLELEGKIRPDDVVIEHPLHGKATITDNIPMSEKALRSCLDDGLSPEDWMNMLNGRVFFWPDDKNLSNHLRASSRRGTERVVMLIDTLSLVSRYFEVCEISPINTGSTIRKPARRGTETFTRISSMEYADWRKKRGMRNSIKEVVVFGSIADVTPHILEIKPSSEFV